MSKNKASPSRRSVIRETLDSLIVRKKAPTSVFVVLLILYCIATVTVTATSHSKAEVSIFGASLPFYTFAGVFSALSEICVIFMTVYFGKKGFYTALILQLTQLPFLMMGMIIRHNVAALPGFFGNLLAIVAITIIYLNNSRMEKYEGKIREQVVTDMLTGLPNYFAATELLNELIKRGERFVNVTININGFKNLNETMGFDAGNQVLKEVADRWKNIADNGLSSTRDFLGHLSGDEFSLTIRNYGSDEDIRKTIRLYEAALEQKMVINNCDLHITASFGYTEYPTDAQTVDMVCAYSAAAMHEVKRTNSSNHIMRFSPELLKSERLIEVESKLREALDNDTVYFNLQPQFDMEHRLRGFEALARMKDSDGNNISPGEFIPVAEKVGLVDKVDAMVLRKAAEFFGKLLDKSGMEITLSVNVSVRHLMKNDFLDEIRDVLRNSGIPAKNLEIEITESIMIDSVDKALQCIDDIRAMGIQIAIDDFGTGYSSLSYLNKFPANLLKVDKSFIDKMNTSDSSRQYVAAIISIGHIMGFDVISEGVEEPEQVATLKEIGCDFIQGFIWGRPLMPDAAEELVMSAARS
jgi:diguanylate cyclase (GGDEF)-like protein